MGARLKSTQMFPPDGLCEYIFFDSLQKDGRNRLDAPGRYDTNLQTFLGAAQMHQITAFGVGISYECARIRTSGRHRLTNHSWMRRRFATSPGPRCSLTTTE
ncbi:uncharacterized protein [Dermacentor albipictus]|uniref:uncharacterized protein n=1 Tax=Dermacentor albipictus TaxID=60249 RepID=UPI0038FC3AA6